MAQRRSEAGWKGVMLLKGRFGPEEADVLAGAIRAFADPVRLRILSVIGAAGGLNVSEILKSVPVSQPTVSHHLKVLSEAGFLDRKKRGTWVFYAPVAASFTALANAFEVPQRTRRSLRAVRAG